jgi:16S rRNA (adenine(1408)-N(1))-methyltransferase
VVDLGTGDGRSVLHAARRDPDAFVIGIDADAASMRESSRKAARPHEKGGVPNAMFVVGSVGSLPVELDAVADEVRVIFPWGSLLRGVLGVDVTVLGGIARVAKMGADVCALVSVTERDGLGLSARVDPGLYDAHGLRLIEARPAMESEIAETNSSWAKRLRAGVARPVTLVRSVREPASPRELAPTR